jgi:hypothetical protein
MKRVALFAGALVLTFAAGVAVGARSVSIATSINPGLVNALNSVGQNLFGFDVFAGSVVPADDSMLQGAVQMDLVAHPPDPFMPEVVGFPKIVNIAIGHPPDPGFPPNPCRVALQMTVDPSNPDGVLVTAIYDSSLVAEGVVVVEPGRLDTTGAFCESVPLADG